MTDTNENGSSIPLAVESNVSTNPGGYSEKGSVVERDTQSASLTVYSDVNENLVVSIPAPITTAWEGTNPYPSADLGVTLSGSYLVDHYTWTSDAVNSPIFRVDAPTILLAIPKINEAALYYQFIRWKAIRAIVKVTSTPYHVGCVGVSHTVNGSDSMHAMDDVSTYQWMNNAAILLDASRNDQCVKEIPWCWPEYWVRTDNALPQDMILIQCNVASVLTMIGSALNNCRISLFLQFVNPEVALPKANSVTSKRRVIRVKGESATRPRRGSAGQTGTGGKNDTKPETKKKSESGSMLSSVKDGLDTAMGVVGSIADFGSQLLPLLAFLDKPTSVQMPQRIQFGVGPDMIHTDGLDNSIKLTASPAAGAACMATGTGDTIGHPTIASLCQTPSYLARFSLTNATAEGARLLRLARVTPGMSPATVPEAGVTVYTPTYLAWFSAPFQLFRGGMKFFFHFVSSPYLSARLRVVYIPPGCAIPNTIADNESGDYMSEVVEINGTMDYEITVGFLQQGLYGYVQGSTDKHPIQEYLETVDDDNAGYLGGLVVYNMTQMVAPSSTLTPTITCLVYVAGAEDYTLRRFDSALAVTPDVDNGVIFSGFPAAEHPIRIRGEKAGKPIRVKGECYVNEVFRKPFRTFLPYKAFQEVGLATSEEFTDVVSLCKRHALHTLFPVSASSFDYSDYTDWPTHLLLPGATSCDHIQWLTACHVNHHGAKRYKFFWAANLATQPAQVISWSHDAATDVVRAEGRLFPGYNSNQTQLEFETAWQCHLPFTIRNPTELQEVPEMQTRLVLPVTNASTTVQVGMRSYSVGDDYAMGVLQAPPFVTVNLNTSDEPVRNNGPSEDPDALVPYEQVITPERLERILRKKPRSESKHSGQ